jgi:hypothetical protein
VLGSLKNVQKDTSAFHRLFRITEHSEAPGSVAMCHCADFHSVAIRAYDGNPVNLNSLPPQESAKRYLDFIGGGDETVAAAQIAFDKGRL